MYMYVYVYIYIYIYIYTHTHTHTYIYIYMHVYVYASPTLIFSSPDLTYRETEHVTGLTDGCPSNLPG